MNKAFLGQVDPMDFENKLVLVRTDYNVPLSIASDGRISVGNDARIKDSLHSLQFLLDARAKIVVCSHLGRPPKGGTKDQCFSLSPMAERLQHLLGNVPVAFADDCIGPKVESLKEQLSPGSILLLENLRFYEQEEKNDPSFAENLCAHVDVYVNEAFAASHKGKRRTSIAYEKKTSHN